MRASEVSKQSDQKDNEVTTPEPSDSLEDP